MSETRPFFSRRGSYHLIKEFDPKIHTERNELMRIGKNTTFDCTCKLYSAYLEFKTLQLPLSKTVKMH